MRTITSLLVPALLALAYRRERLAICRIGSIIAAPADHGGTTRP